ncbi:MAG: hypothetical protein ACE15B_19255 [Bryobacteraceae bacterium]
MTRILAIVLWCAAFQAAGAGRTVYVLPMSNGMDQFLANHLTGSQTLQVVADPKKAELFLTDRLGQSLEMRLAEILPPPAPPKPKEGEEKKAAGDTANVPAPVGSFQATARGKGNVFLVEGATRRVIWSMFIKPAGTTPQAMDKTAGRVVERLKKDLNQPAKETQKKK